MATLFLDKPLFAAERVLSCLGGRAVGKLRRRNPSTGFSSGAVLAFQLSPHAVQKFIARQDFSWRNGSVRRQIGTNSELSREREIASDCRGNALTQTGLWAGPVKSRTEKLTGAFVGRTLLKN
jgi:hypothetical protein